MQQEIFEQTEDIPKAHFYAFRVCNSSENSSWKRDFYVLKNRILDQYGKPNDYDIQYLEKKCRTCNGTGYYYENTRCRNCNNGIYKRVNVLLKRYILNGMLFHEPIGNLIGNRIEIFAGYEWDDELEYGYTKFRYENFTGVLKHTITGLIKHEPYSTLNPVWAYYYLLWGYDRKKLYEIINSDLKSKQHKLRLLLNKYSPLKAYADFYEVPKKELEVIDDLPF